MTTQTHLSPDGAILNNEGGFVLPGWVTPNHLHVRFTHSKTAFRYPPESFIKKLKRFLGIGPKGNPFVKLEDVK